MAKPVETLTLAEVIVSPSGSEIAPVILSIKLPGSLNSTSTLAVPSENVVTDAAPAVVERIINPRMR
jgi:hypothetical protein